MTDDLVTFAHLRAHKICVPVAREFCRRHGLDWKRLVLEGLPCEQLEATGDGMAQQLVDDIRSGVNRGRG